MTLPDTVHLRLSLPYTLVPDGDRVHLIAGEDVRTTLKGSGLSEWLPALFEGLSTFSLGEALDHVPQGHREQARDLIERLLGERVLTEACCCADVRPAFRLVVEGIGAILDALQQREEPSDGEKLYVFCQDRLDYEAVVSFQQTRRERDEPWLWASYGALARGFVSPIFLPKAGPCFRCLLSGFIRLSPVPEIYEHLFDHKRAGGEIRPVTFPPAGVSILRELVVWKASLLAASPQPDAAFRLHVLETESLEISSHRVLIDPECSVCGRTAGISA